MLCCIPFLILFTFFGKNRFIDLFGQHRHLQLPFEPTHPPPQPPTKQKNRDIHVGNAAFDITNYTNWRKHRSFTVAVSRFLGFFRPTRFSFSLCLDYATLRLPLSSPPITSESLSLSSLSPSYSTTPTSFSDFQYPNFLPPLSSPQNPIPRRCSTLRLRVQNSSRFPHLK